MIGNLRIKSKIMLIAAAGLAGLIVVVGISLIKLRAQMFSERQIQTQHLIETASTLVDHYAQAAREGRLSEDTARKEALAAVTSLRYSDGEYFYILDPTGTVIAHGADPKLVGRNLKAVKDQNGVAFAAEMIEGARADGGVTVRYVWPKAKGSTEPKPKIAFAKRYQPWDWIIASGIYVDDVNGAFIAAALELGGASLGVFLLLGTIAGLLGRAIVKPIPIMQRSIAAARAGDLSQIVNIETRDEIADMASDFNELLGSLRGSIGEVGSASSSVSAASVELEASADEMSRNAELLNTRADGNQPRDVRCRRGRGRAFQYRRAIGGKRRQRGRGIGRNGRFDQRGRAPRDEQFGGGATMLPRPPVRRRTSWEAPKRLSDRRWTISGSFRKTVPRSVKSSR